ncbi:TPA: hypothetical protein ACPVP3_005177, partial [Klebsiella pneumoniae]
TLSVLANSFAAIGDVDRALNLLASIHDHCLGYALAARKDPLYSVWKDILILANVADPEHRAQFASRAVRQLRQGEAQMIKTAQNQFPIP